MAILTLNIYSATFFLVWAPSDNICLVGPNKTFSDDSKNIMKIIAVCLPFTLCPWTLYISGQAKALQRDMRGLGFVAGMVIMEVIYILGIGALMTVCMSKRPYRAVAAVTAILVLLLLMTWSCCSNHPAWLRSCMVHCCCCCCSHDEIDVEAGGQVGDQAELDHQLDLLSLITNLKSNQS